MSVDRIATVYQVIMQCWLLKYCDAFVNPLKMLHLFLYAWNEINE